MALAGSAIASGQKRGREVSPASPSPLVVALAASDVLREQLQRLLVARLRQQQQRIQAVHATHAAQAVQAAALLESTTLASSAAEPLLASPPNLTKRQRLESYLSSFVLPTPDSPAKPSVPVVQCTLANAQDRHCGCELAASVGADACTSLRQSFSVDPCSPSELVRRSSSSLMASEGSLTINDANTAMGLPQWQWSPASGVPSRAPSCGVDGRQEINQPQFRVLLEQLLRRQQEAQQQHQAATQEQFVMQSQQTWGCNGIESHAFASVARQSPSVAQSRHEHITAALRAKMQSAVDEASASRRAIAALEAKVAILSGELVQSQRKLATSRSQSAALEASLARSQMALVQATTGEGYGDSDEVITGNRPDQPCGSSCH